MGLDRVVESAIREASKRYEQSEDFADTLVAWLDQLSEQDFDEERNLQYLEVVKNKLNVEGGI